MNQPLNILVCAPLDKVAQDRLAEFGELTFAGWGGSEGVHANPLTPEQIVDFGKCAEVIILGTEVITGELFRKLPRLKLLACSRSGVEGIDLKMATDLGISVLNTPGRNSIAVADFTFGLLIALARKILESHSFLQSGQWKNWLSPTDFGFEGKELDGCTLGIIGFGAIGRLVAIRAMAFGMKVISYDPYFNDQAKLELPVRFAQLEELLSISDFVTLHCALTNETKNLLNSTNLPLLKPEAYLINTARAALIEEEGFVKLLKNKGVAGAALDVFWKEPIPTNHPLLKLSNVLLTPHIAGAGDKVISRGSNMIVEGIKAYFSDCIPNNLVNPEILAVRKKER